MYNYSKPKDSHINFYYTDSSYAHLMAKNYGMLFSNVLNYDENKDKEYFYTDYPEAYYVIPKCYNILEAQENDLLCIGDDRLVWVVDKYYEGLSEKTKQLFIEKQQAQWFLEDLQAKIILRDDKPFIYPKIEIINNEGVKIGLNYEN